MDQPEKIPVEAARKGFAELLNGSQFRGQHVAVTRHGAVAGVLVPAEWYEAARRALEEAATPDA